jgi:hypothetical protein
VVKPGPSLPVLQATGVAGTDGRGVESTAGDLLLEHFGKPAKV